MDVTYITFCEYIAISAWTAPQQTQGASKTQRIGSSAHQPIPRCLNSERDHRRRRGVPHGCCSKVADSDDPDQCHNCHDEQHDREDDANNRRLGRSAGRGARGARDEEDVEQGDDRETIMMYSSWLPSW